MATSWVKRDQAATIRSPAKAKITQQGGDGAREAKAFEECDDGCEEEGEEDGESEGEQEDFGEVEDRDGENRDGNQPKLRQHACGC